MLIFFLWVTYSHASSGRRDLDSRFRGRKPWVLITSDSAGLWSMIDPMSTGGFYINEIYDDPEERIRKSFRGNYARLVDIKTKVDPANFFHLNPNIKPKT